MKYVAGTVSIKSNPTYAPKIDYGKRDSIFIPRIDRKPQKVHPAPNAKATNKYLEMMFGGWN
ncbi:hypothetical protein [Macrococcus bovicus]|uniref:Uncharacterized protein n=1 Tax=Macrococcus bovicus TaxID=69968 RepID=A0A4R6C2X4_9STAP|nr:hypothetical protein [Macrococcus bovicus]TDM15712.1 hypothetical protein ERX55_02055 [Macrococcus bovicus]